MTFAVYSAGCCGPAALGSALLLTGTGSAAGAAFLLLVYAVGMAIPFILSEPLGISGDPIKLGALISTMFFVSGITTLLQGIGSAEGILPTSDIERAFAPSQFTCLSCRFTRCSSFSDLGYDGAGFGRMLFKPRRKAFTNRTFHNGTHFRRNQLVLGL